MNTNILMIRAYTKPFNAAENKTFPNKYKKNKKLKQEAPSLKVGNYYFHIQFLNKKYKAGIQNNICTDLFILDITQTYEYLTLEVPKPYK